MPSPTSSWSDASPRDGEVALGDYRPADGPEALALERLCAQGTGLRLSFRRDTFHRRAEGFAVHRIFTARVAGLLVGVSAVAVKPARIRGRSGHAAFGFDLRVHPDWRGRGVGRRLMDRAMGWGMERADLAYTYTVVGNPAAWALASSRGAEGPGYAYLVLPARRTGRGQARARPATATEVHAEMLRVEGPFDLYCDPFADGRMGGYVASWRLGAPPRAGCSAWSNRGILSEVVESLPLPLAALGALLRLPIVRGLRLPRIPRRGDELRSWYLFDFFAADADAGLDLLRGVAGDAEKRGIDWLYLPLTVGDARLGALRKVAAPGLSAVLPYRMVLHEPRPAGPPIRHAYVDVRDL